MQELNQNDMITRYGIAGFVSGGLISLLVYLLVFGIMESGFSFAAWGSLHREHPVVFLADALPLLTLLTGVLAGRIQTRRIRHLKEARREEARRTEMVREFVEKLISGEYQSRVGTEDLEPALAGSLDTLRETMIKNRETERQRRMEERQRNWISEGLARFGDILRTQSNDIESMSYAVVSGMVRYLDANQGALYVVQEEEDPKKLVMIACHAYDRKKFPGREIAWGDGLIGAVAMEKKGYYTEKLPDGYLNITSGLGRANPQCLLIEPLIWNNQVYGIMEIASFKPLEPYKQQFVSKIAENVATTLNTMTSNLRTSQLLRETQEQAKQLTRQEEQVRQNMEELERTQQEAARQAEQFISFTNTVNHTLMRAEYDPGGMLIYANTLFLRKLGYAGNREVEGRHVSMFIHRDDRSWFESLWERLSGGGRHYEGYMRHENKLGQEVWTMATYTCVRTEEGEVDKILFLAIDSMELKKQSLDYEGQLEAADLQNARAVFSPAGKLNTTNPLFGRTMKYTEKELQQMNVFDFFGTSEQERFSEIWEKVITGEAFQGQLKMKSKFDEEIWFRATFLAVNDLDGEVEKVICLANDITREKEMELASRKQHDTLARKEEDIRMSGLELQRKLEESQRRRKQDKVDFEKEIRGYTRVLTEIPYPVVMINNLGFILFINKAAEEAWATGRKDIRGEKIDSLLSDPGNAQLIRNFADPAKSKPQGIHRSQTLVFANQKSETRDVLLVRTDLKEEIQYTLVVL